jgi:dTMP kinase
VLFEGLETGLSGSGKKGRKLKSRKGFFITFEGPEGSGKSTQMKILGEALKKHRVPLVLTREPGGPKLSTQLRHWILNRLKYNLMPEAELFLFLADRAQHVKEVVVPALQKGKIVLCDRFTDSTLAYQGGGRGFDLQLLETMNRTATGGLKPDLTILFDLSVELGLKRAKGRGLGKDRMEREKVQFHRRVRQTFLKIAREERTRILVVNAKKKKEAVYAEMFEKILARLPRSQVRLFQRYSHG